jgi:truncated hemoglobin YjbI
VKLWWIALSDEDKDKSENKIKLVENTEKILEKEFTGWIQTMENALSELRAGRDNSKS